MRKQLRRTLNLPVAILKNFSLKRGLPPGSIVFSEPNSNVSLETSLVSYDEQQWQKESVDLHEFTTAAYKQAAVNWLQVKGLQDSNLLKKFGEAIGLHNLVLEDIANTSQRAKFEDYEDYFFIELKLFHYDSKTQHLESDQVSLVVHQNSVLTFSTFDAPFYQNLEERIKTSARIRKRRADYLAYAICDVIIDDYYHLAGQLADEILEIENALWQKRSEQLLEKLYDLKRLISYLKREIRPVVELVNQFQKNSNILIEKRTRPFLNDLKDHIHQVNDQLDHFSEQATEFLNLYLSRISHSMNQTMKVLTTMGSIFIPLTFLAGIYGMNFENMPELKHPYGYFIFLGGTVVLGLGMALYFRFKKWF